MSEQASSVRTVSRFLRPVRGELTSAALLGASATLCAIGLLAVSGWLISRASQMPPVLTLEIAIVAVRGFGIGRGFFRYSERLVSHDAVFRALTGLRVAVWKQLERLAPQGVAGFRRGDLLARMVGDVDAIQDLALRVALPVATAAIAGAVSVAVTWWLLPAAGVILLVALLLGATVVPWLTVVAGGRAEARTAPARGQLSAQVGALLSGATDLVACGAAASALDETRSTDQLLTGLARRSAWTQGLSSAVGVLVAGAAVLLTLIAALPAVGDGRLAGVNLAVVVLLPLAAYEAVTALPMAALSLVRVRASSERLNQILRAEPGVLDPQTVSALPPRGSDLRLSGLTVSWPDATDPAIRDVDIDVPSGSRVAIVGSSGAGKSTLVSSLIRFVDYAGSATLGGVELRDLGADQVRSRIVVCAQDAHVFDTTVAANLRIARPDADETALYDVLRRVGLDDFVGGLPAGLDTDVGEGGSQLSGGQRRRLVVARALLADPDVLVFDEPTEHLDESVAAEVLSDVLDATRGKTTILVTHRLRGIEDVDQIVAVDAGRVVERGTHAQLLSAGGDYARRWRAEQESASALALGVRMSAAARS